MASVVASNKKKIRSALTKAGLTKVDNDVLSKCVALASTLHLTPEVMAEVWEAYSMNKQNLTELTMHQFEAYRNELIKVSQVTPATKGVTTSTEGAAMVIANKPKRDLADSKLVTPPTAKRHQSGVGSQSSNHNNSSLTSSVDQVAIPGGESPNVKAKGVKINTILLPKYEERTKVGQVVVSYPSNCLPIPTNSPTATSHCQPRCIISTASSATNNNDDNIGVGRYNIAKPYRHVYTTLEDRAMALEKQLVARKEAIIQFHGLATNNNEIDEGVNDDEDNNNDGQERFAPLDEVNIPCQAKVTCIGRICNESHEGKLNATSVVIEGSNATCGGARINVDLFHMQSTMKLPFSLFPGQIVAVEGMNGTGRKLTAHRILEGAPPPQLTTSVQKLRHFHYDSHMQDGNPITIITACGPFTTSQSMDYQPLVDLMHVILEQVPDVVILTGPFVDVRHDAVKSGKTTIDLEEETDSNAQGEVVVSFEAVFANKVAALIEEALMGTRDDDNNQRAQAGLPTQFVLVPAIEDAIAKWVYPQPPLQDRLPNGGKFVDIPGGEGVEYGTLGLYRLDELGGGSSGSNNSGRRVHCMSNPCTFQINEMVFGVTSTDVLFHISMEETNANLPPGSRLRRIAHHLVQQQSYYPLFPPNKMVNLYLKREEGWKMSCRPDVLILPSRLSPFCSPVLKSTMVVNPGQITKGTNGGTYAVMQIHPIARETLDDAMDDVKLPHNVQDRMQVEVKRI